MSLRRPVARESDERDNPPAPMHHVKYLRAGPAEMPFQNWYTANTNHFHLTDSVRWKSKRQLGWVINIVPHNFVRRIRFGQYNLREQDFEYLYWTISKIIFLNLFTCKGTYMIDWVGWQRYETSIGLFCGKWPVQIRNPMSLRRPVARESDERDKDMRHDD